MSLRPFYAALFVFSVVVGAPASEAWAETSLRSYAAPHGVNGPKGWQVWCAAAGAGCVAEHAATVRLDDRRLAELHAVRARVAAQIAPRLDPEGLDIWTLAPASGYGDCEDFALTHRQELLALGWPRGALDIVFAATETGEIHAVLAVDTDRGTYILDNRFDEPRRWRDLPYRWIGMEQAGVRQWRRLAVRGA